MQPCTGDESCQQCAPSTALEKSTHGTDTWAEYWKLRKSPFWWKRGKEGEWENKCEDKESKMKLCDVYRWDHGQFGANSRRWEGSQCSLCYTVRRTSTPIKVHVSPTFYIGSSHRVGHSSRDLGLCIFFIWRSGLMKQLLHRTCSSHGRGWWGMLEPCMTPKASAQTQRKHCFLS